MAVETAADRALFLADFGEAITIAGIAVTAIVDIPFGGAAPDYDSAGVADASPQVLVRADDVPADPEGAVVVARGITYAVTYAEPDGTGMTILHLHEAA